MMSVPLFITEMCFITQGFEVYNMTKVNMSWRAYLYLYPIFQRKLMLKNYSKSQHWFPFYWLL